MIITVEHSYYFCKSLETEEGIVIDNPYDKSLLARIAWSVINLNI